MTLFEILTTSISTLALGISIWAIIANKQKVFERDNETMAKVKEILEPLYIYDKFYGFEFDGIYKDLCSLFDFTKEFDNYHFNSKKLERIWIKLKKQIIDFYKSCGNTLLCNAEPSKNNPNLTESYVHSWKKEYGEDNMPVFAQERINGLIKEYTICEQKIKKIFQTYAKLCKNY